MENNTFTKLTLAILCVLIIGIFCSKIPAVFDGFDNWLSNQITESVFDLDNGGF